MEPREVISWSHTSMSTFETCPRQYEAKYITKECPFEETAATRWGNEVHQGLEEFVRDGKPLPPNVAMYERYGKAILARKGTKVIEGAFGLTIDKTPTDFFAKDVWVRSKIDVLILRDDGIAEVFDWKGLALWTPLPTPTGWTTMGDVQEGDQLIGGDGKPCTVVGKSQVHHRPCYVVRFDDTTEITCDNVHLWATDKGVVDTDELLRRFQAGEIIRMPTAAPVQLPEAELPIDPYVLGCWLGDGNRGRGVITKDDPELWQEIERRGYALGKPNDDGKCMTRTVLGLQSQLKAAGLLSNKHVPDAYLRASYQQRLDLLRGLMDTDGNANPTRQQAVFSSCNKLLSDQVTELLRTLGQRPNQASVVSNGFGLVVRSYPVAFRPVGGLQPFLLPRKASRIDPAWGDGRSTIRRVTSITAVRSEPTQCVAVDSADHTYLCGKEMAVTHNTGKPKLDSTQLLLYALLVMETHPEIKEVRCAYVWLQNQSPIAAPISYLRFNKQALWMTFEDKYRQLKSAIDLGVFQPKTSGLCAGWCPVKSCEFWKPPRAKR